MSNEAAEKYRNAMHQLTSKDVDVNSLHEALTDIMEMYHELNNAITWDTTCLNCAKLLDELYAADAKLDEIRSILDKGVHSDD